MITEYREKAQEKSYYAKKVQPRLDIIEGYARMGYTDDEIAAKLDIAPKTLQKYLEDEDSKYDKLRESMQRGRELSDVLVENALLKRAIGYKYKEITKERKMDSEGNYSLEITKVVQKEVQPDVGAATYWLEHRASQRWNINPIQETNEKLANAAILKIADLINNPVPVRTPEDTYQDLETKIDKKPVDKEKVLDNLKKEKLLKKRKFGE